jgi:hypothetical protein
MLNRCRIELVTDLEEHLLSGIAIITENSDLNQPMALQSKLCFFGNGGREPIIADHDHGFKRMRFRTVCFALGWA